LRIKEHETHLTLLVHRGGGGDGDYDDDDDEYFVTPSVNL
jgi:hypothetical protein